MSDHIDQAANDLYDDLFVGPRALVGTGAEAFDDDELVDRIEALIRLRIQQAVDRTHVLRCVYCGQQYPAGTPASGSDVQVLTEHIKVCEKHPLREAEASLRQVRAVTAELRSLVATTDAPTDRHAQRWWFHGTQVRRWAYTYVAPLVDRLEDAAKS